MYHLKGQALPSRLRLHPWYAFAPVCRSAFPVWLVPMSDPPPTCLSASAFAVS